MASGDRRSVGGKSCHPLVPHFCGHEPAENRQRRGADPPDNPVKLITPRLFIINLTCTVSSLFLYSFIIHSERSPDAQNSTSGTTPPSSNGFHRQHLNSRRAMDALQPINAAIWRTIQFSRICSPEITIRSSANKWLQDDINATFSGTCNLSFNSQPCLECCTRTVKTGVWLAREYLIFFS